MATLCYEDFERNLRERQRINEMQQEQDQQHAVEEQKRLTLAFQQEVQKSNLIDQFINNAF